MYEQDNNESGKFIEEKTQTKNKNDKNNRKKEEKLSQDAVDSQNKQAEESIIVKQTDERLLSNTGSELVPANTGSEIEMYVEKGEEPVIRDQEYIIGETHQTIAKVGEVMTTLADTLQDGSRASEFEAFASLARTMNDSIKNLSEFHFKVADRENMRDTIQQPTTVNNNLILSGSEMLDKVIEMKEQLNKKEQEE